MAVFIIAEIGVNHNGDVTIAKQLIDLAVSRGCDAVKFQKRTVDEVYKPEFLATPRESPWGTIQRDQKMGLELTEEDYGEINRYCHEKGIAWSASAWDVNSFRFLQGFDVPFHKVASAMLVHRRLLEAIAAEGKQTYLSTGMSGWPEIDAAVQIFNDVACPVTLMHCVSTYPMRDDDAKLRMIPVLRDRYGLPVGYSGHELGIEICAAAVALGGVAIERHITLDRAMYGSDQAASLEPRGLELLVRNVRIIEKAMGDGARRLAPGEEKVREKLRAHISPDDRTVPTDIGAFVESESAGGGK